MKFSKISLSTLFVAALGFLALGPASTPAGAGTATATIAVTANVQSACSITANPLAFGTYSGAVLAVSTSVAVTCTNGGPYTVGLNGGTTTGGTDLARKMAGLTGAAVGTTLNYNLFSDAGWITIWGNTAADHWVSGTGTGTAQTLNVYGQMAAGQALTVGTYGETVTATVTY
jgi:spore coat protein U-like protein